MKMGFTFLSLTSIHTAPWSILTNGKISLYSNNLLHRSEYHRHEGLYLVGKICTQKFEFHHSIPIVVSPV